MTTAIRPESVLIKTSKALEEVDKRTYKLPGRLRAILFMVDGQRTFADLLEQAGDMAAQLEIQLRELATMGFIAGIADKPNAAISPVIAPSLPVERPAGQRAKTAPMGATAKPVSIAKAPADMAVLKSKIGVMLAETLGMRAMMLSTQLDSIRSTADLGNFIDDTARSVATSNGVKIGEQWRKRARAIAGL